MKLLELGEDVGKTLFVLVVEYRRRNKNRIVIFVNSMTKGF